MPNRGSLGSSSRNKKAKDKQGKNSRKKRKKKRNKRKKKRNKRKRMQISGIKMAQKASRNYAEIVPSSHLVSTKHRQNSTFEVFLFGILRFQQCMASRRKFDVVLRPPLTPPHDTAQSCTSPNFHQPWIRRRVRSRGISYSVMVKNEKSNFSYLNIFSLFLHKCHLLQVNIWNLHQN